MNSNYNISNSNNNVNNNNNHVHREYNLNLSDNGLHYFLNGLKLLNKKCSPTSTSMKPPSPPIHHPMMRTYTSFQTAANVAADSAHYYDAILVHNQLQQQNQNQYREQQQTHHHHHNQHRKLREAPPNNTSSLHRKNSPPALIHHNNAANTNRQNHNNNSQQHLKNFTKVQPQSQHQHQQRQMQSSDCTTSNISPDDHYQHYYSYYYNRQPIVEGPKKTAAAEFERKPNRKLPTHRIMASMKNTTSMDEAHVDRSVDHGGRSRFQEYVFNISNDDNRGGVHHVLREKLPNNNILPNYSNPEWFNELPDAELNATEDFLDVKNFDGYDDKLSSNMYNAKRKLRTRSGSEAKDITTKSYLSAETKNVVHKIEPDDDSGIRRTIKLPPTPNHGKGVVIPKKHSPPAHRVLLYNNQSPRATTRHLPRLSPSSVRVQELRRVRNKSPSMDEVVLSKGKHLYTNRLAESNKNTSNDCHAYQAKALSPLPTIVNKAGKTVVEKGHFVKSIAEKGAKCVDNDDIDAHSSDTDDDFDDDLDNVSDFGDSCDSDSSSNSEDGYRSHAYKLTHSIDKYSSTTDSILWSQASDDSISNPDSLLVPSLFPNVPPYLAFSSNIAKGPEVPPELYRILKWRVTNVMPKVVRSVLANSGVRLLKKTNDWMGTWGKHMKSPCFKTIRPYQKINHLPGSFKIGRKDACWKNLQRQMARHGRRDFGFMPKTYIIPHDLNQLRKSWPKYAQRNVKWIIKPPASARGTGIRVVNRWAQIPKRKPLIVQKYIERPLLINGSKFDLRLYVLVTSINPLRVFMYHNGLARFASVKYSDKSDTLNDRCMHLTNYSINKFSSNYSKNEDVNACHGHKWTIKSLWSYLGNRGIRTDLLWEALRNLVLRTILAGEQSINNMLKMNVESKYSCFELFGFDVLLDAELVPWLLEVNISPSLHSELPLDAHVKAPLVQGVLNTALYNVPPKLSLEKQKEMAVKMSLPAGPICFDKRMYVNYLSRAEKVKHNTFTRKTIEDRDEYVNAILDHLTPDDVRCLIIAEDELARCAPLERIFPTSQTYKYLKYTDSPRYYNRLLDAWESRYGNNRTEGIAVLRKYCDLRYHLEVPPSPAKKASSVDGDSNVHVGSEHRSEVHQAEESKDNDD